MSATTISNMVAREGSGSTKPTKSNRKGSNIENPIQSENEARVVETCI